MSLPNVPFVWQYTSKVLLCAKSSLPCKLLFRIAQDAAILLCRQLQQQNLPNTEKESPSLADTGLKLGPHYPLLGYLGNG